MDYAAAINAEARDLKAAGADVIQLDEPWLQAFPDAAMRYGVRAINRALEGIPSTTAVHLCFGYAHLVRDKKPGAGYSFLPQLADSIADQISIEAAQPSLDLARAEGARRQDHHPRRASTSAAPASRRRRKSRAGSAAASSICRPSAWCRRRIAA